MHMRREHLSPTSEIVCYQIEASHFRKVSPCIGERACTAQTSPNLAYGFGAVGVRI